MNNPLLLKLISHWDRHLRTGFPMGKNFLELECILKAVVAAKPVAVSDVWQSTPLGVTLQRVRVTIGNLGDLVKKKFKTGHTSSLSVFPFVAHCTGRMPIRGDMIREGFYVAFTWRVL
jgi:hypothetical protein